MDAGDIETRLRRFLATLREHPFADQRLIAALYADPELHAAIGRVLTTWPGVRLLPNTSDRQIDPAVVVVLLRRTLINVVDWLFMPSQVDRHAFPPDDQQPLTDDPRLYLRHPFQGHKVGQDTRLWVVLRLRLEGAQLARIAEHLACDERTISRLLQRHGPKVEGGWLTIAWPPAR